MNIRSFTAPAIAVGAVALVAAAIVWGPAVGRAAGIYYTPTPVATSQAFGAPATDDPPVQQPDVIDGQAQHAADVAAAQAAQAAADAAAAQAAAAASTHCPDGTSAQSYDDAGNITSCSKQTTAGGLHCPSGTSPQAYDDQGRVTACSMPSAPGGITCPPGQAPQEYNDDNQVVRCG